MTKLTAIPVAFALLIPGMLVAQAPHTPADGDIVVQRDCLVSLIDEVEVPAEETGVLKKLPVELGDYVKLGGLVAQIDDTVPKKQYEIAELKLNKASEQATNEVDIKYAAKAAEVSQAEYEQMMGANSNVRGAIAEITLRKAKLQWEKAILQAEQAAMNFKVAGMTAAEAKAEMEAAQIVIDRCSIESPIEGIVLEKIRHEGEWVRPGEPLVKIVGLKRLKVEGSLDADQYSPNMVIGKPATIVAQTHSGQVSLKGTVVFARPEINSQGTFDFTVEVENRPERDSWALIPGERAKVTIHSSQPSTMRTTFTGFPR
ncbi:efflux RND transporter periplasmic adaptor subunit [Blastopirellula marina]|nr:HlyD family efflux transporter periplasmic adaptor subunit [Blastopirellula marina]